MPSWATHLNTRENPPEFRVGEVARVVDSYTHDLRSRYGLVTSVQRGGSWGECDRPCCNRYSVQVHRADDGSGHPMIDSFLFNSAQISRPVPISDEMVLCDMPPNGGFHAGSHRMRATCVNATLDPDHIRANFDAVTRARQERIERGRRELEQRRGNIVLGRWYYVTRGTHYRVLGDQPQSIFAPVRWLSGSSTSLSGRVTYMDTGDSGEVYVEASELGGLVPDWRRETLPPPGLGIRRPTFAVTVSNGDLVSIHHEDNRLTSGDDPDSRPPAVRRVAMSSCSCCPPSWEDREDHDCDNDCEEYGCEYADEGPLSDRSDLIHPYSYTPLLNFRGDDPLYLGVELELSTPNASVDTVAAQAVRELGSLVYLKADCSIQPRGFEMVHHPMNYDWAYENYPRDALRRLRAAGAFPHESCGMHIHVSRDGFASAAHTFKWMKWFYRNEPAMTVLARRRGSTYAEFDQTLNLMYAKHISKGAFGAERYSAINATNQRTLEVRVFASTLNIRKLLGAMALVDAGVRYNATITSQDILRHKAWEFQGFKDYVHSFKKYAPLQQEMVRLGL